MLASVEYMHLYEDEEEQITSMVGKMKFLMVQETGLVRKVNGEHMVRCGEGSRRVMENEREIREYYRELRESLHRFMVRLAFVNVNQKEIVVDPEREEYSERQKEKQQRRLKTAQ